MNKLTKLLLVISSVAIATSALLVSFQFLVVPTYTMLDTGTSGTYAIGKGLGMFSLTASASLTMV